MTIHIQDTAVAAALERAIGHIGPYSDDELANVRGLRIVGAGSLGDLARCSALEQLAVIGSDVTDLGELSALTQLRRLSVLACPVTSAEALVGLERLEDLRLDFTFVEDASPLFALPSLRRARLVGNPWSETSQKRLEQHGLPASARAIAARPIFELGGEFPARGATRRLRGFGLDLCFGVLDVHRGVLVRPGKARVAGQECDCTSADAADVWLEAKDDWTTDSLFDAVRAFRTAPGEGSFDFDSHRELGDRDDALRWIAAETDPVRRSSLERFLARFPGAVFFREDDAFHAMAERRGGISLPASYRNARAILAGAFAERSAEFRVDRFEGNTIAATSLLEEEVWYRPQLESYENDEGPTIRDVVRMYPFAVRRPQKRSILAVSLEDDQPEIREYRETDIFFALRSGDSPSESVYTAYPSYAELLGHIIAFKLADGVIEAAV
jgi:hypothetical protein